VINITRKFKIGILPALIKNSTDQLIEQGL